MGRKQSIDRGALLDAADRVILREGTAGLTLDAIAAEAKVSKGGVLYALGTKDGVIEAMIDRSSANYEAHMAELLDQIGAHPEAQAIAHVEASRELDASTATRAMALLAGLMHAPGHRERMRVMYQGMYASALVAGTPRQQQAAIAMLAAEALFMLRGFELIDISEAQWSGLFDALHALAAGDLPPAA